MEKATVLGVSCMVMMATLMIRAVVGARKAQELNASWLRGVFGIEAKAE